MMTSLTHDELKSSARSYFEQADYLQALKLYRQLLRLQRDMFGWNHPEMAETATRLAEIFLQLGKIAKCPNLCRRALEIRRHVFAEDHPLVLEVQNFILTLKPRSCCDSEDKAST